MAVETWRIEDVEFAVDELTREFPAIDADDIIAVTLQTSGELHPKAGHARLLRSARQAIRQRRTAWYGLHWLRAASRAEESPRATAAR